MDILKIDKKDAAHLAKQIERLCEKQYRKGFQQGFYACYKKELTIDDADNFRLHGMADDYKNVVNPHTGRQEDAYRRLRVEAATGDMEHLEQPFRIAYCKTDFQERYGELPDNLFKFGFDTVSGALMPSAVEKLARWIEPRFKKSEFLCPDVSSYGLKHIIENEINEYVANGELIAAMITLGFRYERTRENRGPNAWFYMDYPTLKYLPGNTNPG